MTHSTGHAMGFTGNGRRPSENGHHVRTAQDGHEVALIIGGGGDLGVPLAAALAERGMDVAVLFFRRSAQGAQAMKARVAQAGQRCLILYVEHGDRQTPDLSARRLVRRIVRELGGLDVFISLASPSAAAETEDDGAYRDAPLLSRLLPNAAVIRAAMRQIIDK